MQHPTCTRSGPTVVTPDNLSARPAACPRCEARNGLQMLSGSYEVSVERLLLFLFRWLLLCLLRFLGHVALRDPQKFARCKSGIDMHAIRLHHNCKIDTARLEQGKRDRIVLTCDGRNRACCLAVWDV